MRRCLEFGVLLGAAMLVGLRGLGSEPPATPLDVPWGLPTPYVAKLLFLTFSGDPQEQAAAALELGDLGDKGAVAVPFLIRLLGGRPGRGSDVDPVARNAETAIERIGLPAEKPLIRALSDRSDRTRGRAAHLLGQLRTPGATRALIGAVHDKDEAVRLSAISALGDTHDPAAVPALGAVLRDQKGTNERVRSCAAHALAHIPHPDAVDLLLAVLKDPSPSVRGGAVCGLCYHRRDPPVVEALLQFMSDRAESDEDRALAAAALSPFPDPRVARALIDVAGDRRSGRALRETAALCLGETKDPQALKSLLSLADSGVREHAVIGLAIFGDPQGLRLAIEEYEKIRDGDMYRAELGVVLADSDSPAAVQSVISVFEAGRKPPFVRKAALDALALSHKPRAYSRAIAAVRDADPEMRREAVRVLCEGQYFFSWSPEQPTHGVAGGPPRTDSEMPVLSDPALVAPLVALVADRSEDDETRTYAVAVLRKLGPEHAVKPLTAVLEDVGSKVPIRCAAAKELATLKAADAVEPLVRVLNSASDAGLRAEAARALGVVNDRRAVEALRAALTAKEERVRGAAEIALIRMGVLRMHQIAKTGHHRY